MRASAYRLGGLAVVGLLVLHAAASVPWWPSYESARFFVAGVVGVGAGILIGVAGARFRLPFWMLAAITFGAYLLLGVAAAVPARAWLGVFPTPAGLLDLLAAIASSWQQLVSVPVPVGSFEALLVPYFLLALVSSVVSTGIALRTSRPAAALLPPAVLFVVGIALGTERDELVLPAALAAAAATILWLSGVAAAGRSRARLEPVGGPPRPRRPAVRARRVAAVVGMLAVAGVAGGAAAAIPQEPRTVVRSLVQPPFDPREQPSPLSAYRASFDPEVRDEVQLEVEGLPADGRLRVATLDQYDGAVYVVGGDAGNASGRFTRVPYRLEQPEGSGSPISLDVRVVDYRETWLPSFGALERVEFVGPRAAELDGEVFAQPASGTLALGIPLAHGDAYRLDAIAPPTADTASLVPGDSATGPGVGAPVELVSLLDRWRPSDPDAGPGARLAAVVDGFRADGYLSHGVGDDPFSRSGHALDRIVELAGTEPMLGDAEQYSVATALLASELGFPSRVVVGYAGGERTGSTTVFRARDRSAWVEVQDVSGAWYAIDPTPQARPVPPRLPDDPTPVSRPESVLPPPDPGTPVDEVGGPAAADSDRPRAEVPDWPTIIRNAALIAGGAIVGLALIASPFAAVVLAKRRRRRLRRTSGTLAERIEGAWAEVVDGARDSGANVPAGATRSEQAEQIGGIGTTVLAIVIDRQLFGPDAPVDSDVEQAWELSDRLRERLTAGGGLGDRFRTAISLASLSSEPPPDRSSTARHDPAPVTAGR